MKNEIITVYHGSKVPDLKTIIPNQSTQSGEYVYGTTDEVLAAIFSCRLGSYYMAINHEKDAYSSGIYSICERKEGALQSYNCPASIYQLIGTNFNYFNDKNWGNHEVRATGIQEVLAEFKFENMLEHLEKYEKEGRLKIYRYPVKPDYIAANDSDLVQTAFQLYYYGDKKKERLDEFTNLYPQFKNVVADIYQDIKDYEEEPLKQYVEQLYDTKNQKLNYYRPKSK